MEVSRWRKSDRHPSRLSRRTPVVDPDDHHLFVSLGCAAENVALASGARGRPGELHLDPSNDAAVVFEFSSGQASVSALFDAIPVRQSSRADYDGRPVSGADLPELTVAVRHADDRRANFRYL